MAKGERVTARFDGTDKADLREVADRFCDGNKSQVLRLLVREAATAIREKDVSARKKNKTDKQPAS